jgi:hypothetical protein
MVTSRMFISAMTLLHHLDGAGRAGHDAGAQAGQVEAAKRGGSSIGDEHGRHAVKRGAALLGHRLERRERVETLAGEDHRRAVVRQARLPITMPKQW